MTEAPNSLRQVIRSFKYSEEDQEDGKGTTARLSASPPSKVIKHRTPSRRLQLHKKRSATGPFQDLQPSLAADLTLVFVGFNPGEQSSIQQHHYAHFTNLFWKLFNQSRVLLRVLETKNVDFENSEDVLLKELISDGVTAARPDHDNDLVKYSIGFTDLVLRCTKTAAELSLQEKLENVPRLFGEFRSSNAGFVVFVGKGIWEIIVKWASITHGVKFKLTKENFVWGEQTTSKDKTYQSLLNKIRSETGSSRLYVFPNTSGLVASMKFPEKLALWNDLSNDIGHSA